MNNLHRKHAAMIPTSNGVIYSPRHYDSYTINGNGPGDRVGGDIPTWNLFWLSCPRIEGFLQSGLTLHQAEKFTEPRYLGLAKVMVGLKNGCMFPELRKALLGYPVGVRAEIQIIKASPFAEELGTQWFDFVQAKLDTVAGTLEDHEPVRFPKNSVVLYVDFKSKSRIQ